jgi:uncharacterized phage-associated protein
MKFKFDAQKSANAAHALLGMAGGTLNYMVLVKLLYLADREALITLESPITGDLFISLQYGPVLSRILNLIRWGPIDENDAPWFDVVSAPAGYDVKIIGQPAEDTLSGAEQRILTQVFEKYGRKNWQELSRLTHQLPEWTNPVGGPIPISPEQILLLAGKSQEEVRQLREEIAALEMLDREVAEYAGMEFEDILLPARQAGAV